MLIVSTFYHGTFDVGNDGEGGRNVVLKVGNGRMGVHDTLMDIRNDGLSVLDVPTNVGHDYICVDRKFGLQTDS